MSWTDFISDSALERDLLERALPLVPTSAGANRATLDLGTNTSRVELFTGETLGATPASCVELLKLRPFLVGAAWKVLDMMLETSLSSAGVQPDTRRGYTIKTKVELARAPANGPSDVGSLAWKALMEVYINTEDLRHSLVHRRAHTDAANALVGVDDKGNTVRPLSAQEQEAFVRAVLRASELVERGADDRRHDDLLHQLGVLQGIQSQPIAVTELPSSIPEITVIVGVDARLDGGYSIDFAALRERPFSGATHADLILQFIDRPGQELRGRLENAPDERAVINPDNPPDWLT